MSETDSIEIASRRLALALDALEAAAERRGETDRDQEALVTQIHALGDDRARLASELDHADGAFARAGNRQSRSRATDRAGDRNDPRRADARMRVSRNRCSEW